MLSAEGRLARLEAVVGSAPVVALASEIEACLPKGVRPRQLSVTGLVLGMALALADGRPAHLRRAHEALLALPEAERQRLGVVAPWRTGPHALTYRQVTHTAALVHGALGAAGTGAGAGPLGQALCDALLEASVPAWAKDRSGALAVDWTDMESFARPPVPGVRPSADKEASWGHRKGHGPGQKDELFFGYYLSGATMVPEDGGAPVPELVRRATLGSCHADPVPAFVPVLAAMVASGQTISDVLADCGYSHRVARNWALPLRRLGVRLVQDLHPADRGPQGTHQGAIAANGNLYCPAVPPPLLRVGPVRRDADAKELAAHDGRTAELARYKLSRTCADDRDAYHRVACPAVMGKLRCPLRPASMALAHSRPSVLAPPEHPPTCCTQRTITVPASLNAKTAQKHDYPGAAWRRSYARRTGAERSFSTIKDPATNDIARGWCRLMGLAPLLLALSCCLVVRNLRVTDAFDARQADDARRRSAGLAPRSRRRRRRDLAGSGSSP